MILDRVTITGADNSTDPYWMARTSQIYPWVEWGILLSKHHEGTSRFPSLSWIEKLKVLPQLQLSGHLCGKWVRDVLEGARTFERDRPTIARMFQRVQLNFHSQPHKLNADVMAAALKGWDVSQYIMQIDEVNQEVLAAMRDRGVGAVPLFDTSGGTGVEPGYWPIPMDPYSGYAGGLHPYRIGTQMQKIKATAGDSRVWVDVETHVRSTDDQRLVPEKVIAFLDGVAPFVTCAP